MEKLRHRVKLREIANSYIQGQNRLNLGKFICSLSIDPRSFLVISRMFEFIENVSVLLLICLNAVNLNTCAEERQGSFYSYTRISESSLLRATDSTMLYPNYREGNITELI